MPKEAKEPVKPAITFGPFEQALVVLLIMTFVTNPAPQMEPLMMSMRAYFTPTSMMFVMILYVGYHFLRRQEYAREKAAFASKSSSKSSSSSSSSSSKSSSSSSSSKAMSSKEVASKGLPSTKEGMIGSPAPKKVSSSSSSSSKDKDKDKLDPKKDPSNNAFKKNYFLTMNGPGRPALVPFPEGLRPKKGEPEGTLWWDNIPDDAKDLMAPPVDADKLKAMVKNPWNEEMLKKDIELLKLTKKHKEEQERFEKVGHLLHTLFSLLLCFVDMRIGIASFMFFLWRHFSAAHAAETQTKKDEIEETKAEIMKAISAAKKEAPEGASGKIAQLQIELARL